MTFIQRFGSALNLNVHFHTLALDGAYTYSVGQLQAPRFLRLPPPSNDEVERVLAADGCWRELGRGENDLWFHGVADATPELQNVMRRSWVQVPSRH